MKSRSRRLMAFCAISIASLANASPAIGQNAPPAPISSGPAPQPDVIVRGQLSPGELPVLSGTATPQGVAAASRTAFSDAQMFANCAQDGDIALLRDTIDGPARHRNSQWALDRLIRTHSGCYAGYPTLAEPAPFFGDCHPQIMNDTIAVCRAFYDRGALLEQVLKNYAPRLRLTRKEMTDPAVVKRFVDREERRSELRIRADAQYFNVAACMVNLQPQRALALIRSKPGSGTETRLRQWLIGQSPACVNGAKKVTVDPIQFRIYIADAIYSWAVAARGTDSLLPPVQSAEASQPGG